MSSFGSSVVNKTSKKYTPKAPVRRARPAPQTAPTTAASVPQQDAPQTPAPTQGVEVTPGTVTSDTNDVDVSRQTLPVATESLNNNHDTSTQNPARASPKRPRTTAVTAPSPRKRLRIDDDTVISQSENTFRQTTNNDVPLLTPPATQATTSDPPQQEDVGQSQSDQATQQAPVLSKRQEVRARTQARKQARLAAEGKAAQAATRQVADASASSRAARQAVANSTAPGTETPSETTHTVPDNEQSDRPEVVAEQENLGESPLTTTASSATRARTRRVKETASQNASTTEPQPDSTNTASAPSINNTSGESNEGQNVSLSIDLTAESTTRKPKRKRAKPSKKKNDTAATSDTENHEIDATTLSMNDLSKDSRSGKTSGLETRMAGIDWAKIDAQRKAAEKEALERAAAMQDGQQDSNGDTSGRFADNPAVQADNDVVNARLDRAAAAAASNSYTGPQLTLVDGQMVIDETTRAIDRYAPNPEVDATGAALEEIEEDDITRRINRQTWLHASRRDPMERRVSNKSDPWTESQTNSFYEALRMFGTDFYIISRMFVGKTRRHIKLKFNREERADPDRVRAALLGGSVPMDMKVYEERTGKAAGYYKDPDILKQELAEEDERQRAEIEKQKELEREVSRKKMEAARERQEAAKRGRRGRKREPESNAQEGYEVVEATVAA